MMCNKLGKDPFIEWQGFISVWLRMCTPNFTLPKADMKKTKKNYYASQCLVIMFTLKDQRFPKCKFMLDMHLPCLSIKANRGFTKPCGDNNELNQYFTFYNFIVNASRTLFISLPTEARPVFRDLKVWKRPSVKAQAALAVVTLTWDSGQLGIYACSQDRTSQYSLYPPAFMNGYTLLSGDKCE